MNNENNKYFVPVIHIKYFIGFRLENFNKEELKDLKQLSLFLNQQIKNSNNKYNDSIVTYQTIENKHYIIFLNNNIDKKYYTYCRSIIKEVSKVHLNSKLRNLDKQNSILSVTITLNK